MKKFGVLALSVATTGAAHIFHGVAVAPDGRNAWVVALDTVLVAHTPDFGQHWEYQDIPTIRNMWDVECIDGLSAWTCGMSGDIWHTTDGGQSWFRQNLGGPKHAARIRFLDTAYGWAAGGDMVQLSTTNGGVEWTQRLVPDPPIPSETTEYNGVSFVDSMLGWTVAGRWPSGDTFAGGQGFIVRTTDRGNSWQLQRVDTTYDFYDCCFVDAQTGVVVGGNDRTLLGVVLRTTDGGTTWVERPLPASARFLRSVYFVSSTEGWACGRSGTIVHTTDAGQTWVLQPSGVDTTLFDIEFADSERGMACGNSVVLRTFDGGTTWQTCLGAIAEQNQSPAAAGIRLVVSRSPTRSPVRFAVQCPGLYSLAVYDAVGRIVWQTRGMTNLGQQVLWIPQPAHGSDSERGVYTVRLSSDGIVRTARVVLLD